MNMDKINDSFELDDAHLIPRLQMVLVTSQSP